jgi:hypothetical protein
MEGWRASVGSPFAMIVLERPLYRTAVVFFDEKPDLRGIDIVRYFHRRERIGGRSSDSPTLLIDLTRTPDELLADMRKDTRYEIRRAADKDLITYQCLDSTDAATLGRYFEAYDRFAALKRLGPVDRRTLSAYANSGVLDLSTVSSADGKVLVWHAYVRNRSRARLLHSASVMREIEDKEARALLGRANRFHHWKDMLRFKEAGHAEYDLGGWAKDPPSDELRQVNRFKESFGGRVADEYNSVQGQSIKGRLVLRLERAYVELQAMRQGLNA